MHRLIDTITTKMNLEIMELGPRRISFFQSDKHIRETNQITGLSKAGQPIWPEMSKECPYKTKLLIPKSLWLKRCYFAGQQLWIHAPNQSYRRSCSIHNTRCRSHCQREGFIVETTWATHCKRVQTDEILTIWCEKEMRKANPRSSWLLVERRKQHDPWIKLKHRSYAAACRTDTLRT